MPIGFPVPTHVQNEGHFAQTCFFPGCEHLLQLSHATRNGLPMPHLAGWHRLRARRDSRAVITMQLESLEVGSVAAPLAPHSRLDQSQGTGTECNGGRCEMCTTFHETRDPRKYSGRHVPVLGRCIVLDARVPSTLAASSRVAWKSHARKVRVRRILSPRPKCSSVMWRASPRGSKISLHSETCQSHIVTDRSEVIDEHVGASMHQRQNTSGGPRSRINCVVASLLIRRRLWVRGRPSLHCNCVPETANRKSPRRALPNMAKRQYAPLAFVR